MQDNKESLLIFGCGYSGLAIAQACKDRFAKIYGTTRSPARQKLLTENGIDALLFDGKITAELKSAIAEASHVVISIAPNEAGDAVLNACREAQLAAPRLKWLGYLSTVGVYGNHDGAWVDEETECRPVSKRSRQRLAAEAAWQDFADTRDLPLAIFRLSGIYGPGRNTFINMEKGTARRLIKPGQVFNRIRREDIGEALRLAMEKLATGIFNITDDEPAPPQDVVAFAHQLAGRTPPRKIDFETAELSPMARSFYGENKRVSNARSKQVLAMTYRYPDYRQSLQQLWDSGEWQDDPLS